MEDIECAKQLQLHKPEYMWNSGKFFAQMGLVQDCLDMKSNSSYFMANFINNNTKASANLYLGMCLPAMCSNQTLKALINEELKNNQVLIRSMVGMPLAVGVVDTNPQSYTYEASGWFYFTIITIAILIILGIVSLLLFRKKKEKQSGITKILQSFDFSESMKIFTYKSNYLNVFNGIKTICMFWVIWGHQFSVRLKYDVNISGIPGQVEKFFYLFVTGAFLAVDVFFFIGGFLVAYSFMREKSKSILKYPMAIVHRVLRFWPSYIMTILVYYSVYIHTGSGPLWKENMTLGQIPYCQNAWKTLLFVDNLVGNGEKMCMGWGWYLQNDMQVFVFSLIFIYLYTVNRKIGYASLLGMIGVGLFFNIYGVIDHQILQVTHLKDFIKWNEYFLNIYIKPWIRCPPYILGLILGLLHMEYLDVKKKLKEKKQDMMHEGDLENNFFVKLRATMQKKRWISSLSQFIGVGLMLGTIILPHDLQLGNTWPIYGHALYLSLEKLSFTFGVYLCILPTLLEIPNMTFFLMDTKFFNALSKISFWTYLIHFMIVEKMSYEQKVDFYYTTSTIVPIYVAIASISLCFGFLGTILVEVPFSKLEKMLFSVLMKSGKGKKQSNNDSIVVNGKQSLALSTTSGEKSSILSSDTLHDSLLRGDNNINRSIKE